MKYTYYTFVQIKYSISIGTMRLFLIVFLLVLNCNEVFKHIKKVLQ